MKLTVPAIRAAEPNAHRQEVFVQTSELLAAIDSLLAESLAEENSYLSQRAPRAIAGSLTLANLGSGLSGATGQSAQPGPPAAA